MPQIFHPSTNTISKVSIFGAVFLIACGLWLLGIMNGTPYVTEEGVARDQPVPFSHEHHVSGLGIDCRYCHTSVEKSAFAGIPPTETCMNCHSQIWAGSPMLQPVRDSYQTGTRLRWTRVNDLPDFVYFNHSIHINKGVGCNTCHGPINQMPFTWQGSALTMKWCLNCHRNPELYVRPKEQVFNMNYRPPANQREFGQKLVREYHIKSLTDCYTCHR
jgi:hypothetical protein